MLLECINTHYSFRLNVLLEEFIKSLKYSRSESNNHFLFTREVEDKANMPCIVIVLKSNRRFNQYLSKLFDYKDKVNLNARKESKVLTDLRGFEKKLKMTIKYIILLKKVFGELVKYLVNQDYIGQAFINLIIDKFAVKSANYIKTKLSEDFEQLNTEQMQTIDKIIQELTKSKETSSIKRLFEKNVYFEIHYVST